MAYFPAREVPVLQIFPAQMDALRKATTRQQLEARSSDIHDAIHSANAELLQGRSREEALQVIQDVILAAARYDILDFDDLCKWAYLRFAANQEFYNLGSFRYFLEEPLLHPKAKARNIVTAFQMAIQGRS
jgi:hypothetical protein